MAMYDLKKSITVDIKISIIIEKWHEAMQSKTLTPSEADLSFIFISCPS